MGYIEKSLGEGERLVGRARFHWLYTLRAAMALIVPLLLLFALVSVQGGELTQGMVLAALIVQVLGLMIFLRLMIRKWTTEIGVTSHRFVKKTGWLSLHTDEIALPNIEGIKINQGFWGGIFGYGHLRIEGTGIDKVELPTIADPVAFRRAIETAKGIKA